MTTLKAASLLLTLCSAAMAQTSFSEERFQVSPYLGPSFYHGSSGPNSPVSTGVSLGGRITENIWKHFGLEQTLGYSRTKFELLKPLSNGIAQSQVFENGLTNFHFDGLYYFTERGFRWRPYLIGGIGGARFGPSDNAASFVKQYFPGAAPNNLKADYREQFNFGGGLMYRLTDRVGFRGDVRELFSRRPEFGILPNSGALRPRDWLSGTETTAGLVFNFGGTKTPAGPTLTVSPITATPLQGSTGLTADKPTGTGVPWRFSADATSALGHPLSYQWMVNGMKVGDDSNTLNYTPTQAGPVRVELQVSDKSPKKPSSPVNAVPVTVYEADHKITIGPITADPASALAGTPVTPGTNIRLTAPATDSLGHKLTYQWTVNGQPAGDGSSVFNYQPMQAGRDTIGLRVICTDTSAGPVAQAVSGAPVTIVVRDTARPTATCSAANPATVTLGQTAALSVAATVAQGNTARIRWTVPEGSLSNPTAAQTTFNSAGVSFPQSPLAQSKTVTATATVTDDSGAAANCTTAIRVTTEPQSFHYGDLLFGEGSARVNNAAKRVLIERLYPQLTGDFRGYTLVLVGHMDRSERGMRNLDRSRVMDAAAALTAAKGACMSLEPSRIQADWVGVSDSEYKEADTAGAKTVERPADMIRANDARAKNRRVEVWLIPNGKPMPPSVKQARTLPAAELTRLGCPR
jgi:outer membrane protein OmpA-like peptidoglycan-associated protein